MRALFSQDGNGSDKRSQSSHFMATVQKKKFRSIRCTRPNIAPVTPLLSPFSHLSPSFLHTPLSIDLRHFFAPKRRVRSSGHSHERWRCGGARVLSIGASFATKTGRRHRLPPPFSSFSFLALFCVASQCVRPWQPGKQGHTLPHPRPTLRAQTLDTATASQMQPPSV